MPTTLRVPNIGDFKDVAVIEILVKPGDTITEGQSLVTVESDKASMEVPATAGGVVEAIKVKMGDKINEGSAILDLVAGGASAPLAAAAKPAAASAPAAAVASAPAPAAAPAATAVVASAVPTGDYDCDVVVIGGGPGGYTAAFRAADLGQKVVLVERYSNLGGVCLNVGCIPSKALLHAAKVMAEAEEMKEHGLDFPAPKVDIDALRRWKEGVIGKLTGGLGALAKARSVTVLEGVATFADSHSVEVVLKEGGRRRLSFRNAIVAAGSQPVMIPSFPNEDKRLWDSTDALALPFVPKRLLIVGGGIIGLEMACVYDALGSKVTVVEFADALIPAADNDLVNVLLARIKKRYAAIHLSTKVTAVKALKEGLKASFEGPQAIPDGTFDAILVAVGRRPSGALIGADKAGVEVNSRGFIVVDKQQRSNVPHIFAIGDICGDPMLAHKATTEAKIAAEVIAGHKVAFDAATIPSVAYTDPEIAWMGLTEREAQAKGIPYSKGSFPWAASGRALAMGRSDGITKIIYHPESKKVLGMGIVGVNAGELLAAGVLALEMGADLEDIALTIHAHPTLSETVAFAAEMALGVITDLLPPKKK